MRIHRPAIAPTRSNPVQKQTAPSSQFAPVPHLETQQQRSQQLSHSFSDASFSPPQRPGKPLPEHLRNKMEQAFSADFSDVGIHEDSSAEQMGAIAYTQANQIHFQPGKFDPTTAKGQALLGHELAHIVQQRQGRVQRRTQAEGVPLNEETTLEQEAEVAAQKVTQNQAIGSFSAPSAPAPAQTGVVQRYKIDGTKEKNKFVKKATESDADFRTRMGAEMQALRKTMDDKNQDPDQLEKGDLSALPFKSYAKQKNAREAELEQLRKGELKGGREIEFDKATAVGTAIDTAQTQPSVTGGATRSSVPFGKTPGSKIKTLSGGKISSLEHALTHPRAYPNPTSSGGVTMEPLLGIADRQKDIMKGAKEADPLMQDILTKGDLSRSHFGTKPTANPFLDQKKKSGKFNEPIAGSSEWDASDTLVKKGTTEKVYSYGMEEFGNKEGRLPTITNPPGTAPAPGDGAKARPGRYSEADLTPRTKDPTSMKAIGRDARRLVYSGSGTEIEDNSLGVTKGTDVPKTMLGSPSFYLTTDHYTSFVPITPVKKPMLSTPKYADPEKRINSLAYQDEKRRTEAAEQAKSASTVRSQKEDARVEALDKSRMSSDEQARQEAFEAAMKASTARSQKEDTRVDALVNSSTSSDEQARQEASEAAMKASQKTDQRQAELARADEEDARLKYEKLRQQQEELEELIYGDAGL